MGRAEKAGGRVPDADAIAAFRDRPGVWLSFGGAAFLLLYAERLRPLRLKPSWVTALALVAERPGLAQSALGRALRINRASAMALATKLEGAGYVSRTAASGRPQTRLALTALGRTRLDQACALEERLVAETMGQLGAEPLARFVEALKQVTRAADALAP